MQFWSSEIEKQVGDRVQTILNDPVLLKVFQRFGAEATRRSSIFHGMARFLTEQKVQGRLCFEIGTWNGLTAAVLSRFFDQVVTVDVAHNPARGEILDYLGITNVRCVDIRDNADKAAIARDLRFDFAYVDGDHANDTESDFAITRRCGRVLFHEAWPHQEPVWKLVNSLPPHQVVHNGMGLALWDEGRRRGIE